MLLEIGLPEKQARSSIRFGVGRFTKQVDIEGATELFKEVIQRLKDHSEEETHATT